jgi:hypothetical protein
MALTKPSQEPPAPSGLNKGLRCAEWRVEADERCVAASANLCSSANDLRCGPTACGRRQTPYTPELG